MVGVKQVHTAAGVRLEIIRYPRPWIFHAQLSGHFSTALLEPYVQALDETLNRAKPSITFHDWAHMSGYDSECRKRLMDWVFSNKPQIAPGHILVRSKIVAMGVTTANLLLGGSIIKSYTIRSYFEAALANARGDPPAARTQ